MKKKIIAIAAAVAILAVAIVGGTLAWLTSTDTVTNTFTVGNVDITLLEHEVDTTTGKKITNAGWVSSNSYHIVPGDTLDKDPTVTVKANSEPCYVYVYIDNQLGTAASFTVDPAWEAVTGKSGLYQYKNGASYIVAASASNNALPAVFSTVTIEGSTLDNSELAALGSMKIIVKAYAIQSDNVTDTDADGLAWTALHG